MRNLVRASVIAALAVACAAIVPATLLPKFSDVADLSYRFYEAQMSGELPAWSRPAVSNDGGWRGNSHLQDGVGSDGAYYPGVNLAGGWYENGGHVKVSLTMGATASLLAYSALAWENAAKKANLWLTAVRNVRWVTDYFVKCHYQPDTFVAQIGDLYTDDCYWGRPENQTGGGDLGSAGWRPVYTITKAQGIGADVASQAAATVAATAVMLLRPGAGRDASAAAAYWATAESLYSLATSLKGVYTPPDGNVTLLSRTYRDDQTWAAAWMCRYVKEAGASGATDYCAAALAHWESMAAFRGSQPFLSADNMAVAAALLLRDLHEGYSVGDATHVLQYTAMIDAAYARWITAEANPCEACSDAGLCKTHDGFLVLHEHGSAHYTANMALVALASVRRPGEAAASGREDLDAAAQSGRMCWAYGQVSYLLGANTAKRAYVVGLNQASGLQADITPPARPRHRASSCDLATGRCRPASSDNLHVLAGALVGGPGWGDGFVDSRNSHQSTVSIEYNAGFTGALLGLSAIETTFASRAGVTWALCQTNPAGLYAALLPTPPAPSQPDSTTISNRTGYIIETAITYGDCKYVSSQVNQAMYAGRRITSVTVTISIEHEWYWDLDVFIASADGTSLALLKHGYGWGSFAADRIYTFADGGTTSKYSKQSPVPAGIYAPEGGSLSATFGGKDPTGTWTLTVGDCVASAAGKLYGWTLYLEVA